MDDIPLVMEALPGDESEQNRVLQGCVYIEDALKFRLTYHKVDSKSLKVYRLYHSKWVQWSVNVLLIVIHLLIFFEAPSSLSSTCDIRQVGEKRIVVPSTVLLPIEGICLFLLSVDCFVKTYSFGIGQIKSYPWHLTYAACLLLSFAGWFIAAFLPCCMFSPCVYLCHQWRCLLRPAFLIQHSSLIKKALKCIAKAFPSILSVLLLILLHMLLFTLIGLALFPSDKGPVQSDSLGDEGKKYFSTASVALANMFVLLTTANNPNIMTKAYNDNRFYSLFFIIYVGVGIFCFLNILLAVVFQQFREYFSESMRNQILRRRAGLVSAFHVLSDLDPQTGERAVPARRLATVLYQLEINKEAKARLYNRFVKEVKYESNMTIQDSVDVDISWKIFFTKLFVIGISESRQKFADRVLQGVNDPISAPIDSYPENDVDSGNGAMFAISILKLAKVLINFIRFVLSHQYFVHFGSVVNVFHVLLIIIQTSDDERKTALEISTYAFVCYYLVEQIGLMWSRRPKNYFKVWVHRMDLFFTLLIMVGTISYLCVSSFMVSENAPVARYATVGITHIMVGCRLCRVVLSLKLPNLIVRTMADLLVNLTPFVGLLVAQFYMFAVLGMMLFSGKITYNKELDDKCWEYDNSNTSLACRGVNVTSCRYGNDYHEAEFWSSNFDDFASAIVVLWNLMVVNNWQILLHAYARATSGISQIYFVVWHILTVLICLDLFIAVIVENFNRRWNVFTEERKRRQMQDRELAERAAGIRLSDRQCRLANRHNRSKNRSTRTQSQPMRLAHILGVEAPNMDLVREHLLSNPHFSAPYAADPDSFLAVYDTESEEESSDIANGNSH